jgi:hypothetical protein
MKKKTEIVTSSCLLTDFFELCQKNFINQTSYLVDKYEAEYAGSAIFKKQIKFIYQ